MTLSWNVSSSLVVRWSNMKTTRRPASVSSPASLTLPLRQGHNLSLSSAGYVQCGTNVVTDILKSS
eukprot:CAMPEP_0117566974 /NCGR_PEP_ID=MMETSP0784-20121206/57365_1 /TAXON_ID=39447 /ORGANISM="" /LENGTH=65 /DNA_ID=CAMNT_0005364825 /DNA_START=287 /DNA_END=484 /DNA_ORIENTATION=-